VATLLVEALVAAALLGAVMFLSRDRGPRLAA
jgi:hypothetical protein